MKRQKPKREWKIEITLVPFESERDRDQAYRDTIRTFRQGKDGEVKLLKNCQTNARITFREEC